MHTTINTILSHVEYQLLECLLVSRWIAILEVKLCVWENFFEYICIISRHRIYMQMHVLSAFTNDIETKFGVHFKFTFFRMLSFMVHIIGYLRYYCIFHDFGMFCAYIERFSKHKKYNWIFMKLIHILRSLPFIIHILKVLKHNIIIFNFYTTY